MHSIEGRCYRGCRRLRIGGRQCLVRAASLQDEREIAVYPVAWKLRCGSLVGLKNGELVIWGPVLTPAEKDPQYFRRM